MFIDNIPIPVPGKNQALVKVKAFGLNRMDLLQREGKYPVPPQAPSTMGVEFSGIIQSFGDDAEHDFKVGDEVFGLAYGGLPLCTHSILKTSITYSPSGAYAEYIAVSTHMLVHKPPELSWEETAGIPEVCNISGYDCFSC